MQFIYNMLYRHRDELLSIEPDWATDDNGGIEEFEGIDISILNALISLKFINPDSSHNESPTVSSIQVFMTKYPQVLAAGYAVSPYRDDYRVSIDMLLVDLDDVTDELEKAFLKFAANADVLDTSADLIAWWD